MRQFSSVTNFIRLHIQLKFPQFCEPVVTSSILVTPKPSKAEYKSVKNKINKWTKEGNNDSSGCDQLVLQSATAQEKLQKQPLFGPKKYFLQKLESSLNVNQVSNILIFLFFLKEEF